MDKKYHLAVEGSAWGQLKEHFPQYIRNIVAQGSVFARMSPDQKVQVVEHLQELDYVVGMCGDGANDCGVSSPILHHIPKCILDENTKKRELAMIIIIKTR